VSSAGFHLYDIPPPNGCRHLRRLPQQRSRTRRGRRQVQPLVSQLYMARLFLSRRPNQLTVVPPLEEGVKTDSSEVMDCGIDHQRKHEPPSGQCEWSLDPKEGAIDLFKNGESNTSTVERREG
jgi:hypothetical protein